ncbi:MAG: aminoacyl-tRNA hydrolase [Candidatus Pacebacteria bacterium]|nr:aminoacyl-tRNA hydrolase [Candidatus Paceibacterota bacterium]
MFLIVGLGNPGEKYEKTRHNAGFIVVDQILGNVEWGFNKNGKTQYFKASIGDEVIEYLKPQTFMNESGISVRYVKDKHDILEENIVVLYDDIDLPVGKLRISHDRGNGGHNGIKSIEQHLGTTNFTRIRIGISHEIPDGNIVKPNVLGVFSKDDFESIKKLVPKVKDIVEIIVKEGREKAMNKFN